MGDIFSSRWLLWPGWRWVSCSDCVLQQGLGSVVAAGGGAVTGPVLSVGVHSSVPSGVSFSEKQKHPVFWELALPAVEIESMKRCGGGQGVPPRRNVSSTLIPEELCLGAVCFPSF
jgi:hypothetical protein